LGGVLVLPGINALRLCGFSEFRASAFDAREAHQQKEKGYALRILFWE
jgi:hypothetical protein